MAVEPQQQQQQQAGTGAAPNAAPATAGGGAPLRVVDSMSTRVDVINTHAGRILCVADVRGALSTLNSLAAEHAAVAIIHTGDFGFYEPSSLSSISDRTLKHLVQYSPLIAPAFRSQLLSPNTTPAQMRDLLANPPPSPPRTSPSDAAAPNGSSAAELTPGATGNFGLSEFPRLLSGDIRFNVPVYTVWGACEDVAVLEKIRLAPPSPQSVPSDPSKPAPLAPSTATRPSSIPSTPYSYSIPNLTVLDEATTRCLLVGGVRLRLFGLGGAVVPHKLFDNGQGSATIAGGQGTMWTTMLQIGELVDTAQKVYDPSETRLLISHASPGREGLLSQLALVLKADLTVSAGLHFRYGVSYNEFSVQHDPDAFRTKLEAARKAFNEIWEAVKNQVEGVVDESQRALLQNALAVANRVPANNFVGGAANVEEAAWKNCWNWNLPDAQYGNLIFDVRDGRMGSEMKSQGFNFAYRQNTPRPPSAAAAAAPHPSGGPSTNPHFAASTPAPPAASRPVPPPTNASTTTPAAAPSLPFSQRGPFSGGPNGPAGGHVRQPMGPRGRGRGGFGAPGSTVHQQQQQQSQQAQGASSPSAAPPAGTTSSASPVSQQQNATAAASAKKDETNKPAPGVNGGVGEAGSQTPAPHQQQQQQRTHSGRGQRGQTPHQRQQAREQAAQAAAASDAPSAATASAATVDSSAAAAASSKKQQQQNKNDAATAAGAGNEAANTTVGDSSATEGGGPMTPGGGGDASRRGGRGGGGSGRGRGSRGRSNGEWTRGAGRAGRENKGAAGESGGSTTPGPEGGKKTGGGGESTA